MYMYVYFCVVLEPYKYAGYPMLIKTIQMETQDDTLFSKAAPLLTAATELCYHTVNCSALNAEELRRERGIEVSTVHGYTGFLKFGWNRMRPDICWHIPTGIGTGSGECDGDYVICTGHKCSVWLLITVN